MKLKQFLFYPLFLFSFATLMVLFMWAAYALPIQKIRATMQDSAKIINMTPRSLWYSLNVPGEMIDKNTDARMLNMTSILRYDNAFYDSLSNPELVYEWWAPRNLKKSLETQTLDYNAVRIYPRFWHGYLIFLKPLSLFLTLDGIRNINLFLQALLLFMICYLIYKRLSIREVLSYLTVIAFLNPVTSWMCLEYATDINIMLLASLLILLNKNQNDNKIFFITGAVTIAFDFITFPLITLGIPLTLHIALYKREFKNDIECIIKNSLLWVLGYASMWSIKWGIATGITKENIFNDAWGHILHRSYGYLPGDYTNAEAINFINVLKLNVGHLHTPISYYYLGGCLLLFLISFLLQPCTFKKNLKAFALLLISAMPFIWYSVLINHSIPHYWFTYRELVIFIFGVLMSISCLFKKKKL